MITKIDRSTKQIVEVTTPLAPGGDEIIPFNREIVKPQLIEWNDNSLLKIINKQIEKMVNSGHESIAIICKTMKETNALYKRLKEIISIHLIHAETYTFQDRKSTRLNSSHVSISYAVFCLKKKNK